ncbi:hypothetical protein L861_05375 [Litchfieldella anticariensis FP35 = DSM 16096]|uniref:Uncharacterized protein n=1 Tax=Litchfieldella anticariensis (strain DSM 16096 / CECT 5854 / CIP 108499 / LMG 22089 / FP35) TaxID=1121939 RepID=S2KH95_LITA3|nr:hypothetical protein L861_05375 [Halomonas anticariensis FP35 = DSM 16096]
MHVCRFRADEDFEMIVQIHVEDEGIKVPRGDA